jgi:amino acid transporter
LSSVLVSGAVGVVFLLAIILSLRDIPKTMADGLAGQFPVAQTIQENLSSELIGGITVGEIYLFVILASVFVCTLAIQGAATRMMFSMGRDGNLPGSRAWSQVSTRFRTPTYAAIAVGILAAIPILLVGPIGGITLSIAATGLIYLSYFLCNIGLLVARRRGWPHQKAWFSLGRWGMPINILALIWGAIMLVNIALWASPELFGDFGSAGRNYWNPLINALFAINGQKLDGLPAWPLFETLVGLLLVLGSIYYLIAVRGRAVEIEADAVTGEGVIG